MEESTEDILLIQTQKGSMQRTVEGQPATAKPSCSSEKKIPQGLLPSDFAYVTRAMPESIEYMALCHGPYPASHQLNEPGYGGMQNFAIAQCNKSAGCPVIREFDTQPTNLPASMADKLGRPTTFLDGVAWSASQCGHWFSLASDVEGKLESEYLKRAGICKFKYAIGGHRGNLGTYRLKCILPLGYVVAVGQTQSTLCTDGAVNFTLGPKDAHEAENAELQLYGFNNLTGVPCEFCKLKEGLASECADSPKQTSCS